MFSALALVTGAAGWFVSGRSWFTNILAALGIAAVAGLAGMVTGYVWASDAAKVADLQAKVEYLNAEIDRRAKIENEAAKLAEEADKASRDNETVERETDDVASRMPDIPGVIPREFLDGLRRYR